MKSNIEIKRLKEIISYLETNPIVECNPYPQYEGQIDELLMSLGIDVDYMDKHFNLEDKEIADMNLEDIKVMYTFILRGERFCDGHIKAYIEDQTLLELAKRQLELMEQ